MAHKPNGDRLTDENLAKIIAVQKKHNFKRKVDAHRYIIDKHKV